MNENSRSTLISILIIVDMLAAWLAITAIGFLLAVFLLPWLGIENTWTRILAGTLVTGLLFVFAYKHIVFLWNRTAGTVLVFTLGLGIMIVEEIFYKGKRNDR